MKHYLAVTFVLSMGLFTVMDMVAQLPMPSAPPTEELPMAPTAPPLFVDIAQDKLLAGLNGLIMSAGSEAIEEAELGPAEEIVTLSTLNSFNDCDLNVASLLDRLRPQVGSSESASDKMKIQKKIDVLGRLADQDASFQVGGKKVLIVNKTSIKHGSM